MVVIGEVELSRSLVFLCLTVKIFKCEKPRELSFKSLKSDSFDVREKKKTLDWRKKPKFNYALNELVSTSS